MKANGNKIKCVVRANNDGSDYYLVGQDGVATIGDNSREYPDSIHIQFDAYDDAGKLIGTFINGALDVAYF